LERAQVAKRICEVELRGRRLEQADGLGQQRLGSIGGGDRRARAQRDRQRARRPYAPG
jgi:hypothetical protein